MHFFCWIQLNVIRLYEHFVRYLSLAEYVQVSIHYCRFSNTILRFSTPFYGTDKLKMLFSPTLILILVKKSNLWERTHSCHKPYFLRRLCSKYWAERYPLQVWTLHDSQLQFRGAEPPKDWYLWAIWQDFPLIRDIDTCTWRWWYRGSICIFFCWYRSAKVFGFYVQLFIPSHIVTFILFSKLYSNQIL